MIEIGLKNTKEITVTEELTASNVGSGLLPVFATPSMIALMEATASESVMPYLEEGTTTVGTHLDISHLSADPVGMKIVCESELIEIDGRKLVFNVTANDKFGVVGKGTHERFIVKCDSFMKKAEAKLN